MYPSPLDGIMVMVSTPRRRTRVSKEEEVTVSAQEEQNKALVRRFWEAVAKGNLDAIDDLLAPEFVDHSAFAGQDAGREGYKQQLAEQHAVLSDLRFVIEDQVAKDDKVVTRITWRSIHDRGEYFGLMPRGTEVEVTSMTIHRIVGGKITEECSEGSGDAEVAQAHLEQERIERERVEQDLRVARSIQQTSLPKEVPTLEGWQISPYCRPSREVGGDFYDFHLLSEGQVGLAVGDATGKGVTAALVMTGVCAFLGGVATASGSSSPGEVLAQVNEALLARIPPNMFVTCFYAILDPKSGRFVYANVGHNLPCCCHNEHAASDLCARGMTLGLMPGMSYEENETTLVPGECHLFYTDGLVEAHNPQGEMFGTPAFGTSLANTLKEGGA
jgi:predicted ester cyclase